MSVRAGEGFTLRSAHTCTHTSTHTHSPTRYAECVSSKTPPASLHDRMLSGVSPADEASPFTQRLPTPLPPPTSSGDGEV